MARIHKTRPLLIYSFTEQLREISQIFLNESIW